MKKQFLAMGALLLSSALFASPATEGQDTELFLKPFLKKTSHQLSLHIGSTLPRTMQMIANEGYRVTGLGSHFQELAEKLERGDRLVVTAPASFGIVFTDATTDEASAKKTTLPKCLTELGRAKMLMSSSTI